jgi:hypothetical protein
MDIEARGIKMALEFLKLVEVPIVSLFQQKAGLTIERWSG